MDLLLRTYNVPDGTLFVDGQDVNTVSIHSVRNACAYVPQDNFLFSDTIAHNISFGVDDATQEDIDRAAALADVRDNIVDFKDGYETVLGERSVTVSGGQKQRSLARAGLAHKAHALAGSDGEGDVLKDISFTIAPATPTGARCDPRWWFAAAHLQRAGRHAVCGWART